MADDLAAIRVSIETVTREIRALTRAGRSQAEAIVAADAADAERVAALTRAIEGLGTKLDALALVVKPAGDYFAARNAAHGKADGEELDAERRLTSAKRGFVAAVLGDKRVQGAAAGIVLAILAGLLGLVTGTAGAAQQVYNGSPKQEATDAAHVDE